MSEKTEDTHQIIQQPVARHEALGLSTDTLRATLYKMLLARAVDDRLWLLTRQGKAHFVITSAGQEATQLGCALALNIGRDYLVPYYRDMAFAIGMGQTALDILRHAMGKPGDPASNGRQMFGHFSSRELRMVSGSSSVGSHLVHASGLALALKIRGETGIAVMTCFGEGATAEGAWHEGVNFAGIQQLPVVFVCQNNQYAISMPPRKEVPVKDVATKAEGYGMPGVIVDGNDLFAVYEVARAALNRARSGGGPTLIECKTYRLRPHSNADNDMKYRTREEVDEWRKRDPLIVLQNYLIGHGLLTLDTINAYREQAQAEVDRDTQISDQTPDSPLSSLYDHLYGDV